MMKHAYDLHTVHNTIEQEKKDNVYQLHSNNIYQLYNSFYSSVYSLGWMQAYQQVYKVL